MPLLKNIRFYILIFSISLSVAIYLLILNFIPDSLGRTIKLNQDFAFLGMIYLYIALLATPLTTSFKFLPLRAEYVFARRAIGVSAFYFVLLHVYFAFFKQLGGFSGLGFLSDSYLISIGIGAGAFLILMLMAVTSTDWFVDRLGYHRWKLLHRFVYLATLLAVIHTFLLGSHFLDLSGIVPTIFMILLGILLFFEARRFDSYLESRFGFQTRFGLGFMVLTLLAGAGVTYLFLPSSSGGTASLGIHAYHIQLAKQAQSGGFGGIGAVNLSSLPGAANNPGLIGDPTRRFTVSFKHDDNIEPNQDTTLDFQVYDANSGVEQDLFSFVYTKLMHLVIVDSELKYFAHIHPTQQGSHFLMTTQFPHPGQYHVYIDFQPLGAIEQQFGFTVNVGGNPPTTKSTIPPDKDLTKTFGDYKVTLIPSATPLLGSQLSIGAQTITFRIADAKTGQGVTNLKPYLASFGHLVLINENTYDYIHVHPSNVVAPKPTDSSGPTVEFLPLGLYGPIKPGVYRAFAQFNPDNKLFTADFTIEVK